MRIKIFIFPLILLIALYLVIAQIFPDFKRANQTRANITEKNAELVQVQERQAHISQLFSSFAQNRTDYEEVFTAVPENRETEFMINQIGKLVQNHGMTLTLMGFQDGKKAVRRNARVVEIDGDNNAPISEPQKMQVSANISGPYDSMRELLTEVFFLGRTGQFLNVEIERIEAADGDDGVPSPLQDFLTMTVAFDYYVMPQFTVTNAQTFTHPLIEDASKQFDYSSIASWRDSITKGISGIAPVEGGRNNPFLPN